MFTQIYNGCNMPAAEVLSRSEHVKCTISVKILKKRNLGKIGLSHDEGL